jgi:hypothetical protein
MEMGSDSVAPLNLLVVVLVFGLWLLWSELWRKPGVRAAAKGVRSLKPKTRADCPLCRVERGDLVNDESGPNLPRPWREGRSRRGRKKESATEGYACDNGHCMYYGITDPAIHALAADGHHGKYERIQDLKCQACSHEFTVRRHTVLYRLKTQSARVAETLTFLAEGVDVSVLERVWQLAADFIYGQVKKLQRRRRLVKVEQVMLYGSFEVFAHRLKAAGLSGRLNTASSNG